MPGYLGKLLPQQVTRRIYLLLVITVTFPMIVLALAIHVRLVDMEKERQKTELYRIAAFLEQSLPGSYDGILTSNGALNAPFEQKINILNSVLQPIVNDVTLLHPSYGAGYYSRELDYVLAFGPNFALDRLRRSPADSPYRRVYVTGELEYVEHNNSSAFASLPVLDLAYPVYRDGQIIGHTWANVTMSNLYAWTLTRTRAILFTTAAMLVLIILIFRLLIAYMRKELRRFAEAVAADAPDLPEGTLPELRPVMEAVRRRQWEVRMSTVAKFAASVIHEIRNPLTSIRGFAQLLITREEDRHKKAYIEFIIKEIDELNSLVSSFLKLTRQSTPSVVPVDVCGLLRETEVMAGAQCLEARVFLETLLVEGTLDALCDASQIRQVLLNLVDNALQAMAPQGGGTLVLSARPENGSVLITVCDTGPGIPQGDLEKIFEPFYTTRESGTGLGLPICRRLVESQGGNLTVWSGDGEGTVFTIMLPGVNYQWTLQEYGHDSSHVT